MEETEEIKYLNEHIDSWIGSFLFSEKFPQLDEIKLGIVSIIDIISNLKEEGILLTPEIIVTTNLSNILKPIPYKNIISIGQLEISPNNFNVILKRCSYLAMKNWTIFIEIIGKIINYGLLSSESSDLSPSTYDQIAGKLSININNTPMIYIKILGDKNIEVKGNCKKLIISLSLNKKILVFDYKLDIFINDLVLKVDSGINNNMKLFYTHTFEKSFSKSGGCLIALIDDENCVIEDFKNNNDDGIYLQNPIDLNNIFLEIKENNDLINNYYSLTHYANLITNMIYFDGITLLSNKGKILGYNIFVKNNNKACIIGGARKRAFIELQKSKYLISCLFKSYDGKIEIWRK